MTGVLCSLALRLPAGERTKRWVGELNELSDLGCYSLKSDLGSLRMIDPFIIPTKRPTRAEFAVIVVFFSFLFMVLGIVALLVALRAAPEKHELAVALARYGWRSLGFGVVLGIAFWLVRRFKNSV